MTTDKRVAFGQCLLRLRKAKGLSQTEVATALGLTTKAIGFYELGLRTLPPFRVPALSEALGITPEKLLEIQANADRYELSFIMPEVPEPFRSQIFGIYDALAEQGKIAA